MKLGMTAIRFLRICSHVRQQTMMKVDSGSNAVLHSGALVQGHSLRGSAGREIRWKAPQPVRPWNRSSRSQALSAK